MHSKQAKSTCFIFSSEIDTESNSSLPLRSQSRDADTLKASNSGGGSSIIPDLKQELDQQKGRHLPDAGATEDTDSAQPWEEEVGLGRRAQCLLSQT